MNELLGRMHLEDAIARAKGRNARRMAERMTDRAGDARDDAARLIADHPFVAVAAGLAVGVAIGLLLPRKAMANGVRAISAVAGKTVFDHARQLFWTALQARIKRESAAGRTEG